MTRKIFGTDGIRGKAYEEPLTSQGAEDIAKGSGLFFLSKFNHKHNQKNTVIIGRDTRESCDFLEKSLCKGFISCGIDVILVGVVPSPAVSMLTFKNEALFGVVISASHNLFSDNGIKFFQSDGTKLDDETESKIEDEIFKIKDKGFNLTNKKVGSVTTMQNAKDKYIDFVCSTVNFDKTLLKGLNIALDLANGSGFKTNPTILKSLGANVISFNNNPNGVNINESCGCNFPSEIERIVQEEKPSLGISFDGDSDRVMFCDENGSSLDGDEVMAIAAINLIKQGKLKHNTLVATIMSNEGLNNAIENYGGKLVRTNVGDRYISKEMKKFSYNLGGEQSGHFIFSDFHKTGDGIISAVQVLKIIQSSNLSLSELRKCIKKFPQILKNIKVSKKVPINELKSLKEISKLESNLKEKGGRILLRYSGTENLLRVLVESYDIEEVESISKKLCNIIKNEIG